MYRATSIFRALIVASLFAGLAASIASAQDGTPSGLQPEDLDGIQHGVARSYRSEIATSSPVVVRRVGESTPTPQPEATPATPSDLYSLSAIILEFDTAANANIALDRINTALEPEILGTGVEAIELGLGDEEISFAVVEEFDDKPLDVVVTLVQQEQYVYLVNATGSAPDMQTLTHEFTTGLIETGGSGEGEFHEDGTSTGGLWNKFPPVEPDNDLIANLSTFDQVLFPVDTGDSTPVVPCGCTPPVDG